MVKGDCNRMVRYTVDRVGKEGMLMNAMFMTVNDYLTYVQLWYNKGVR